MNVLKIASFIGVMLCGVAFGQPPGPPINPAQVGSNPLKSVVITDAGEVVSGSGGSGANPAFKLPGGIAGMWDDWGTGGLAFSYAAGTTVTFYQGGTVGKLFLDTNGLQLPIANQFRFGVIGGAPDAGLGRASAGVLKVTNGTTGLGALTASAIRGDNGGTGTVVLDGDSGTVGQVTIDSSGGISASGGSNQITLIPSSSSALFVVGSSVSDYTGTYVGSVGGVGYLQLKPATILGSGGSNILELINGGSAQTFRIYGTESSAKANYERLTFSSTPGSSLNITAETSGTGGDNLNLKLEPAGTGAVQVTSPGSTSGKALVAGSIYADTLMGGDFDGDIFAGAAYLSGTLTVGYYGSTGSGVLFEGTADGFETTLLAVDPTADRTVNLPNASGTVILREGTGKTYTLADATATNVFTVSLPTQDTGCAVEFSYVYFVTDTANTAIHAGTVVWAITNDDGTVTGTAVEVGETVNGTGCSAGCDGFSGGVVSTTYTGTMNFDNSLAQSGTVTLQVVLNTCSTLTLL